MHTEIILLENLDNKGKKGDILKLKLGYAKYLITKKFAIKKTRNAEMQIAEIKKHALKQLVKEMADAKAIVEQLNGKTIIIKGKSHEDKLYGSITINEVAHAIETSLNFKIDKKKIEMPDHIKDLGDYEIKINLHPELSCKIKLIIEAE